MICSNCNKEMPDGLKFCGYCGHNLEGKVKCKQCGEWVDGQSNFCPFCSNRIKQVDEVIENDQPKTERIYNQNMKSKITKYIYNSMILLCSILMVIVLFGKFTVVTPNLMTIDSKIDANIIDYANAAIKGMSNYSFDDFKQQFPNNRNHVVAEFLNIYMIDQYDQGFLVQRLFIYINLVLMFVMAVLPLIILGISIYDTVCCEKRRIHNILISVCLIIGLVVGTVTLPAINFVAGSALIFYILLCGIALISSYVYDIVMKNKKFSGKTFTLSLLTTLGLLFLIILSTSGLVTIIAIPSVNQVNSGDFLQLMNNLYIWDFETQPYWSYISRYVVLASRPQNQDLYLNWTYAVEISIYITMFTVTVLLIFNFINEIIRNLSVKIKKRDSVWLTWLIFGLEVLAFILIIINVFIYNGITIQLEQSDKAYVSTGIILLLFFTLGFALYQTITSKMAKKIQTQ